MLGVESHPQGAPLIPQLWGSQHCALNIQEWLLQAAVLGYIDPDKAQLLSYGGAAGPVSGTDRQHRVPQATGNLSQAQLDTAPRLLQCQVQAAAQGQVLQHLGEAAILVLELHQVAEVAPVCLTALLDVLVTRQQVDGRVAVEVKLGAVVKTTSWEVS